MLSSFDEKNLGHPSECPHKEFGIIFRHLSFLYVGRIKVIAIVGKYILSTWLRGIKTVFSNKIASGPDD